MVRVEVLRLLPILLLANLLGCTQWHYDLGARLSLQALQQAGEKPLPLSTVLAQLGPPQRISAQPGGYLLAWEHWNIRETSVGFSLGALGAELLSLDWGDAQVAGEFLLLGFDRQHRLVSSSFSVWDRDAGSGKALQPFFGMSLVEVDDLVRAMPQHRWGANSLQRLPEALNTPSAPDSGAAGLEQRGTPAGTGQRSLEMRD